MIKDWLPLIAWFLIFSLVGGGLGGWKRLIDKFKGVITDLRRWVEKQ